MALLDALPLTYFHVFPYSRRAGTTAAKLPDHVAAATIKRRAQRLRNLGERKRAVFARRFVGQSLPVLVEHAPARDDAWLDGYSRNYQRVRFQGAAGLANHEVMVRIAETDGARLIGTLAQSYG
jgi:threonylcarbamoyladenosine tRNA methylthiotransferase MtaB